MDTRSICADSADTRSIYVEVADAWGIYAYAVAADTQVISVVVDAWTIYVYAVAVDARSNYADATDVRVIYAFAQLRRGLSSCRSDKINTVFRVQ